MTEPIADRATVQTVTIDGTPIAQAHVCSSADVAHRRIELEASIRRELAKFAKDRGLTVPEGSVRIRWKLEIEGTAFETPYELRVEIGRLRYEADRLFARGLRHAARKMADEADELEQGFASACQRAYEDRSFLRWSTPSLASVAEQLADLAKLEERQLQNRSAVVDE